MLWRMASSEKIQVPVILWHPDGQRVAVQGREFPRLEVERHGNLKKTVQEAWQLATWELHDAGIAFGMTGTPRLLALSGELPAHLSWLEKDLPPLPFEQVWQRPDWQVCVRRRLEQAGVQATDFSPVHSHDLTSIVRAQTPAGEVFLKTSSKPDEMRFKEYVAADFPDVCPPLLACQVQEGWQVTASGGQLLDAVADLTAWQQAIRRLTEFQQSAQASRLAALGARAYPFEEMRERIPAFLSDTPLLRSWVVPEEKIRALQDARPTIRQALEKLAALKLPDLPAHGDAHPRNALYGERGSVWFDWSETLSAAHPFMDLGWFLGFTLHPARQTLPVRQAHPELEAHLTQSVLRAFDLPATQAPLLGAAMTLAYLHRAVVYDEKFREWQGNVPGWRPNYVPFSLRQAARELTRLRA
ncbi:hypothetical protein D3875_10510 [Deinococcus cavernae]|uniref:Aminoglycoside phosphotransferase domain-containing protein n=2 Tax=Deinococcus cavernae TaxID=2320857 RepID=A0A418V787_9DEIO|nr:hypothetical protein D3875_10510 [Deinococcus cavernae]